MAINMKEKFLMGYVMVKVSLSGQMEINMKEISLKILLLVKVKYINIEVY